MDLKPEKRLGQKNNITPTREDAGSVKSKL